MTRTWKAVVVVSLAMNVISWAALWSFATFVVDNEIRALSDYKQLSVDQQKLRRRVFAEHPPE